MPSLPTAGLICPVAFMLCVLLDCYFIQIKGSSISPAADQELFAWLLQSSFSTTIGETSVQVTDACFRLGEQLGGPLTVLGK
jgi:hypothetical protein